MALDVGDRRIGVALSDPSGLIAQPLLVYERIGYTPDSKYMEALAKEHEVETLVLGLPLNMDGSLGFQGEKVKAFGKVLETLGLPIVYQDERLSTVSAHQVLLEGGMSRAGRKTHVDKVAAAFILETYLQSKS